MKRELKVHLVIVYMVNGKSNRKAHPDEKGTESFTLTLISGSRYAYRKAHPDEKGTESKVLSVP